MYFVHVKMYRKRFDLFSVKQFFIHVGVNPKCFFTKCVCDFLTASAINHLLSQAISKRRISIENKHTKWSFCLLSFLIAFIYPPNGWHFLWIAKVAKWLLYLFSCNSHYVIIQFKIEIYKINKCQHKAFDILYSARRFECELKWNSFCSWMEKRIPKIKKLCRMLSLKAQVHFIGK